MSIEILWIERKKYKELKRDSHTAISFFMRKYLFGLKVDELLFLFILLCLLKKKYK